MSTLGGEEVALMQTGHPRGIGIQRRFDQLQLQVGRQKVAEASIAVRKIGFTRLRGSQRQQELSGS